MEFHPENHLENQLEYSKIMFVYAFNHNNLQIMRQILDYARENGMINDIINTPIDDPPVINDICCTKKQKPC